MNDTIISAANFHGLIQLSYIYGSSNVEV